MVHHVKGGECLFDNKHLMTGLPRRETKLTVSLGTSQSVISMGTGNLLFFLALRVDALQLRAFNSSKKGKYIKRKDYQLTRVEVQFSLTSDSVKSPWLATTVNLSSSV